MDGTILPEAKWIKCSDGLPPEGIVVITRSAGGLSQSLKRRGRLWFFPDNSMYVYYEPIEWMEIIRIPRARGAFDTRD